MGGLGFSRGSPACFLRFSRVSKHFFLGFSADFLQFFGFLRDLFSLEALDIFVQQNRPKPCQVWWVEFFVLLILLERYFL